MTVAFRFDLDRVMFAFEEIFIIHREVPDDGHLDRHT